MEQNNVKMLKIETWSRKASEHNNQLKMAVNILAVACSEAITAKNGSY